MRNDLRVEYIDPDNRVLFVQEIPDSTLFGVFAQKGDSTPRRLRTTYTKEDYLTREEADNALNLYISNMTYNGGSRHVYQVVVNGKHVTRDEYIEIRRGEMPAPEAPSTVTLTTLANVEYRIGLHMRGAYGEMLNVGRCLVEAKDGGLVPHGRWEDWVRQHTGFSERQAQRLMQAARNVRPGSAMEKLEVSKIQALLALEAPEREAVAEKAVEEDLSLKAIQEEVRRRKTLEAEVERMTDTARDAMDNYQRVQAELRESRRQMAELEHAGKSRPEGISGEAQREIERLQKEVAQAEAYAETQAEARQQAQEELLSLKQRKAQGETGEPGEVGLSVQGVLDAGRAFIAGAGTLPHAGQQLSRLEEGDREAIRQCVDMVAAWCEGARKALAHVEGVGTVA